MQTKEFLSQLEHDRIVATIREAEAKTSGEIRLYIERGIPKEADGLLSAQRWFKELGMEKTRGRNAVLIYVAPKTQRFAVVGDIGVGGKCGPDYWNDLVGSMRDEFRQGHFTDALVLAITRAGDLLAGNFPCRADDTNELPDEAIDREGA